MKVVGIDGCKSGWVAVFIDSQGCKGFEVIDELECSLIQSATFVMIDMPIGLPDHGYRDCDIAARQLLGAARSRVFLGARRPLLEYGQKYKDVVAATQAYQVANRTLKSQGEKGLSKQMFYILPKIKEVDDFLSSRRQDKDTFRECHPELVFMRLNANKVLPNKKSKEGQAQRIEICKSHGFDEIEQWLGQLKGKDAKPDDLLDACACTLAAKDAVNSSERCVESTQIRDSHGLKMEIWY